MKVAVVGHVEWIEFVEVEAVPQAGRDRRRRPRSGRSLPAAARRGGGAGAARRRARSHGLLGGDDLGAQRAGQARGGSASASTPPARRAAAARLQLPRRRRGADDHRHRDKLGPPGGDGSLPWEELDESRRRLLHAGDAEAVRAGAARACAGRDRPLAPTLHAAGVELDALVASGEDDAERYQAGDLDPPPRLVVSTAARSAAGLSRAGLRSRPPRPGRSRTRTARRLLRRRAHVRARTGDGDPGRARVRLRAGCAALTRRGAGLTG